ncbi:Glucuronoyl esterase catalytic domain from Hypocrea Jecorina, partial [Mycena sp. CBHHK59/15]
MPLSHPDLPPTGPTIPSLTSYNNPALPDPFTFAGGAKVVTTDDWACRSAEISTLLQMNELGTMPGTPQSVTASFSGTTLSITVTDGGKSITFKPTITYPSTGTAPFPAIIGMGGISIPSPAGVAIINFDNEGMGAQDSASSRGQGLFFNLYGSNASAGAMMAWAWGVRRIMDALVMTPAARINAAKVAVSGCSRNGKGALVAGAFEPRIVLTIPQESGSGGTDSWRISDAILANGTSTQTASEIIQENVWFSTNFNQFATSSVKKLPVDHHLLSAMVAPRGLFVIDNIGYDWLGPFASYGAIVAARTVYTALGAPSAMGFSQAASHTHCVFPSTQQAQLTAFVNKFLFGQATNTNITETAGGYSFPIPNAQWAPWTPPVL